MTFREMVLQLLLNEEDPEKNPPPDLSDLQSKVDDIKWAMSFAEAEINSNWARIETLQKELIEPLRSKVLAQENRLTAFKNRVKDAMITGGFNKMPGHIWRMDVQNGPTSLEISLPCNAEMCLKFPEYVSQKTFYNWDLERVKSDLALKKELPFTVSQRQSKSLRFYVREEE